MLRNFTLVEIQEERGGFLIMVLVVGTYCAQVIAGNISWRFYRREMSHFRQPPRTQKLVNIHLRWLWPFLVLDARSHKSIRR